MDPKSLANLDPKLRETYERVMGTTTGADGASDLSPFAPSPTQPVAADAPPAETPPAAASTTDSSPAATTPDTAFSTPQPAAETPAANETATSPTPTAYMPVAEAQPAENVNPYAAATPFPSPAEVAQSREVSPILRILYIVGAVIFFIAYTFFWVKIFNLPLPF